MRLELRCDRGEIARLDAVAGINRQSRQAFILTALNSAGLECSDIVIFARLEHER